MSIELDPREVLAHLHELGYYNVTPDKLEEFMKDLKKLIKYDTNKRKVLGHLLRNDDPSSTLQSTTDESGASSPPRHNPKLHSHPETARSTSYHFKNDASCGSSESSLVPTRRVLRECTKHAVQASQEKRNIPKDKSTVGGTKASAKPPKTCDCMWRRIGCKCCDENYQREQNSIKTKSKENLIPPRPKSSFIRTWQTTGQSRPGSAGQRCDPVSLYHQYQQVWKQQKLPGENNHSDLRWTIRERMLGQEPHPRSCNCDCRCCPCKLKEQNFAKNPKKVSSKILPRGPFHVEGLIKGPLALDEGYQFVVKERRLEGTFELKSCSEPDQNQNNSKYDKPPKEHHKVLADWVPVSNDELKRPQKVDEHIKSKQTDHKTHSTYRHKTEELNFSKSQNKNSCKDCGLIHYVLNPDASQNSTSHSQRSYWPERFTAKQNNGKGRENEIISSMDESSQLNSMEMSDSTIKSSRNQSILNQPLTMQKSRNHSDSDDVFEAAVPINLKDFKGEVKTEIKVPKKRCKICKDKSDRALLIVATEPLSQASSVTSIGRRRKLL